jgi:methylenetetrahydrofolate reductase (NADPH)
MFCQGFENLVARIARLISLNPLSISITWGAGGSTKERSLELAGVCQSEYNVDTMMHLTCTNMEEGSVDDALRVSSLMLGPLLGFLCAHDPSERQGAWC